MIFWCKETRGESGKYYRKVDWGVEMPDDWDNGKGNFTKISPPVEAFDGIPCDWDENLGKWVLDVAEKERLDALEQLKSSDNDMPRITEDLINILVKSNVISLDNFPAEAKSKLNSRAKAREALDVN